MAEESIFRLLAVRPAKSKGKSTALKKLGLMSDISGNKAKILEEFKKIVANGGSRIDLENYAKKEKEKETYVDDLRQLEFDISIFADWLNDNSSGKVADIKLETEIKKLYGRTVPTLIKSKAFISTYDHIASTLLVDSILEEEEPSEASDAISVYFKAMHLMIELGNKEPALDNKEIIGDYISNSIITMPNITNLLRLPEEQADDEEQEEIPVDGNKKLKDKLEKLGKVHREITKIATDSRFRKHPDLSLKRQIKAKSLPLESRLTDLTFLTSALKDKPDLTDKLTDLISVAGDTMEDTDNLSSEFILSARSFDNLSTEAKEIIKELKYEPNTINPIKLVSEIEREISYSGVDLKGDIAFDKVITLGGAYISSEKFNASIGYLPGIKDKFKAAIKQCKFKAGIGDLLMVKQKLKAYELAEFAHIENVLAGELRDREHRRLNIREEEFITEFERETENERNLQSTERHELQNEAEKTIKTQFELEAGLQISGSYGPAVSFSASLNTGFSASTEETKKKVSSYSREVTEKTSERVRERVREERRNKTVEEIEETNRHAINNEKPENGHIRGIYRWLNKIYDAQVFNYGQRMMYEFIIPEPAAFFLYALVDNPPSEMELIKPKAPTYFGNPLKPSNLTRGNYHNYISSYQVTNTSEPPAQYQTISFFDKQDKTGDHTHFGRSGKIDIPKGYEAYGATVQSDYTFHKDKSHHFRVMVGSMGYDRSNFWGAEYHSFATRRQKEVAYAMHLMYSNSFTLGVDVFCELTNEGFADWQHDVYDSIMAAYLQQKADYEEKLAAQEIAEGIQILGRNPLENRRMEKDELKKLCVMMLTGQNHININLFKSSSPPRIDISKTCKIGSQIRFFENAFEWQNMLYVLYPYFWGRFAKWVSALHLTDPDPDFAAFLKAGAARVQVPVRPGFEKAVAHFCQFGKIWEGNDIPLKDDDLYVPIIDEITENLGKIEGGVPYPEDSEPWEVTVPTSLIVLQDLDEVANIRDILTGQNINILNEADTE